MDLLTPAVMVELVTAKITNTDLEFDMTGQPFNGLSAADVSVKCPY